MERETVMLLARRIDPIWLAEARQPYADDNRGHGMILHRDLDSRVAP